MYKSKVESLLKLQLSSCFEEKIYHKIYDSIKWMDYYEQYKEIGGFLPELEQLGTQRHLYLPYLITYLENRCAMVFFILANKDIVECPYGGFISVTISEGYASNLLAPQARLPLVI